MGAVSLVEGTVAGGVSSAWLVRQRAHAVRVAWRLQLAWSAACVVVVVGGQCYDTSTDTAHTHWHAVVYGPSSPDPPPWRTSHATLRHPPPP